MKKVTALFLCYILLIMSVVSVSANINNVNSQTKIFVNGKEVNAEGVEPYTKGGVLMVPFRAIAEAMGARVEWIDEYQRVESGVDCYWLSFCIGDTEYEVYDIPFELDEAPELKKSRTYVPLNLFSDVLGAKVEYNSMLSTVDILYQTIFEKELSKEVVLNTGVKISVPQDTKVYDDIDILYIPGFFQYGLKNIEFWKMDVESAGDIKIDAESLEIHPIGEPIIYDGYEALRYDLFSDVPLEEQYDKFVEEGDGFFVSAYQIYYLIKASDGSMYNISFTIHTDEFVNKRNEYSDLFERLIGTMNF